MGEAKKKTVRKKITLPEVAKREGVSLRTVESWARMGKRHGLDPRNVEECKQIRALAGSGPGAAKKAGAFVVDASVSGDMVKQLENARVMTESAFVAFSSEQDGSEQGRLKREWERAVEAQMKIERTVAELQRSEMIHVDEVRAVFHSAWAQMRAKLEAAVKVLPARLRGENEVGVGAELEKWVGELTEGVRADAERRIDSV